MVCNIFGTTGLLNPTVVITFFVCSGSCNTFSRGVSNSWRLFIGYVERFLFRKTRFWGEGLEAAFKGEAKKYMDTAAVRGGTPPVPRPDFGTCNTHTSHSAPRCKKASRRKSVWRSVAYHSFAESHNLQDLSITTKGTGQSGSLAAGSPEPRAT